MRQRIRADPGGETKFGISKRSYPGEDIKNLTLGRAKQIYLRDFWGPAGCDAVPAGIRFDLFDMAVNSASRLRSARCSARSTRRPMVLGPLTLQAVQSVDPVRIAVRFNAQRLAFMASLPNWPAFGRGWANRIASNL